MIFGLPEDASVALEGMMQATQQVSYILEAVLRTESAGRAWNNLNSPLYALASDSRYHRAYY